MAPFHERAFVSHVSRGMTRSAVIDVARKTGGSEVGYGDWSAIPQRGIPFQLEVGIAEAGALCWTDWKVYWLSFDKQGRLKSWSTDKTMVVC